MKTSKHLKRTLGFESLESRELLSVAPLTYPTTDTEVADYRESDRESDWFEQVSERPALSPTSEGVIGNEWIIQLKESSLSKLHSVKAAAEYLDGYGVSVIAGMGSAGLLHVRVENGTEELHALSQIEYVDFFVQNYVLENQSVIEEYNDPQIVNQWYLDTINIAPAWGQTKGEDVVIAVIDTGIQLNHRDLYENIWTNPGEIAGNGIDDEGNGFVDDVHGWNTAANNNDIIDTYSHGTHVACVIGAIDNNSVDTVGVASNATILPIRAGERQFSMTDIVEGINYAIQLKTELGVNIRAINLSVSHVAYGGDVLNMLFQNAGNAGIVVVAAAGNETSDNDVPLSWGDQNAANKCDNVIVVAATDQDDSLAWFSNYGDISVDLAAPGEDIWLPIVMIGQTGGFGYADGTSFSAPMVSGAAALLASAHPDWTAAQIKEAILATVDVLPSLQGKVASGGRLNIGNAINYNPTANSTAPEAPSDLSVVKMSNGILQLKWADNSRNESSFELQYSSDNGNTWNTIDSHGQRTINALESGLRRRSLYQFHQKRKIPRRHFSFDRHALFRRMLLIQRDRKTTQKSLLARNIVR